MLWECKVRKHRAPKGALRHCVDDVCERFLDLVRKHRAPKGALRHAEHLLDTAIVARSESTERQKVH